MYKEIKSFLAEDWKKFQEMFLLKVGSPLPMLDKVNDYLTEHAGKQLRPILTLLTARALTGSCNENVIRSAAAVEMLHTATLLHDDVADNSPIRRGAPTVMALYSPTTSVLVGDFWLSRAIETIVGHCDQRVILSFAHSLEMLAEGEMIQMERALDLRTTEEDYAAIIYRKTAALFETAVMSAAYSVQAGERTIEACKKYSYHLGLAFQIMDDIFDYSPHLNIGKPTGQDILEKKITLPLFGFMKNAPRGEVADLMSRIRRVGGDANEDFRLTQDAVELVGKYKGVEYARERLEKEISQAKDALDIVSDNEAKGYLLELAGHMAIRTR